MHKIYHLQIVRGESKPKWFGKLLQSRFVKKYCTGIRLFALGKTWFLLVCFLLTTKPPIAFQSKLLILHKIYSYIFLKTLCYLFNFIGSNAQLAKARYDKNIRIFQNCCFFFYFFYFFKQHESITTQNSK